MLQRYTQPTHDTAPAQGDVRISLVTVVRNRAGVVRSMMRSVQSQTCTPFEYVVQDGASTDGTLDVLEAAGKGLPMRIESAPDLGIYHALNCAIQRTEGDVVGMLHSDDFLASPETLARITAAFRDPDVDGVYGDLQYVSARDHSKVVRHWRAGTFQRQNIRRGWMPPHPTLYLRREVYDRFGLYDPSFQIAADYDAFLRFCWEGGIRLAYVPEVLVKMRMGGESNRSIERIMQKSKEDLRAIRANNVGGLRTLALKNVAKVGQFFVR